MMQEVEVLKTIPELVCSYFSEEQFTLSGRGIQLTKNTRHTIIKCTMAFFSIAVKIRCSTFLNCM